MSDDDLAALRALRLRWYAEPVVDVAVPHPSAPLGASRAVDTRAPALGCIVTVLGVVYLGNLIDVAVEDGSTVLAQAARVGLAACVVAIPLLLWVLKRRSGIVLLDGDLARPWLDVREGLRLGAVEPANPAWGVALAHAGRVRELVARASGPGGGRRADAVAAELQEAGAAVWSVSEAWRREQSRLPERRAVSPLERLPPAVGPSPEEASRASDAAADAATEALGLGDHDIDFRHYARRRAGMYARAPGPDVAGQDPAQPLLVDTGWAARTRRLADLGLVVFLGSAVAAGVLLRLGQAWASLVACLPALVAVIGAARLPLAAASPRRTMLPPGAAMAWSDYLGCVAYADSGQASVTTVEAIRGGEQRVRAILLELLSPTLSDGDREPLAYELYRMCSQAWTLVGQERAEVRLIDELPDASGG